MSPQIQDILGYPAARFYADVLNWLGIVHPDDRRDRRSRPASASSRVSPWDVDYRMIADDGRVVWMHLEGRTVERDDARAAPPAPGHHDGRHERAGSGRSVRDGRRHTYVPLVESTCPASAWTYSVEDPRDWRPIYIAPQVEQLLGYTVGRAASPSRRFFQRLVHPDDRERILAAWRRAASAEGNPGRPNTGSSRATGHPVAPEHREPRPGRRRAGRCIHGLWLDITAERERRMTERLRSPTAARTLTGAQPFGFITHADSGRYGRSFAGSTTEPSAC